MGCPTGECIHLADFTQRDVISVEGVSSDASKLALNLIDVFFFTKDILSTSLATRWEGRDLLDPEVIEGIGHVIPHAGITDHERSLTQNLHLIQGVNVYLHN